MADGQFMKKIKKIKYSWIQFEKDVAKLQKDLYTHIPFFKNVYGIPKGGLVLATTLAYRLGKPLITDPSKITNKTLIVDDISDTGNTLGNHTKKYPNYYLVVTLFIHKLTMFLPNYFYRFKKSDKEWVVMPWE